MAKNREPEKPVESESESGEEASSEEAGSDESDSEPEPEPEPEPEQTQAAKKPSSSSTATQKKSQPQQQPLKVPSSSSDEEESGSESESESDGPSPNIKPIASKPMDDLPPSDSGAKKSRSKPNAADVVTPTKSTASKRSAEEKPTETKDGKKSKKKTEVEGSEKKPTDDSKKLLFQRLWSEGDEIEILKGMIDYAAKKKSDPIADLSAFHDYIRENLHVDVTRTQLQDKIRRLKKKYENNKSKVKEGKNRTFSKPHELKAYELSKMIWDNDSGKENDGEREMEAPKANGGSVRKAKAKRANVGEIDDGKDVKKMKVSSDEKERFITVPTVNSMSSVEERIMKMGAEFFETGKGLEGEKEWKRLKVEELEVHLKQLDVRRAQTKLVLDALKPEDQ